MATIVNNPGPDRVVETSDNSGWAVAVIVLLAVVVIGAFVWMRYYNAPAATTPAQGASINVTIPAGSTDNSGSAGGSASGDTNTAPAAQ